jgi:DegV family protein with EDD domain
MKIIADSSFEENKETREIMKVIQVPFHITINGKNYIDDGSINIKELLKEIKESPKIAKTACPSPTDYLKTFEKGISQIVVTISSKLSGSYSSAVVAKNMFLEEEDENAKIHILDSKTAACGESLIALKLNELNKLGFSFDEIIEHIQKYIDNLRTFFILEDLGTLSKSGRLNKVVGKIATFISLRPIMKSSDGDIKMFKKVRGTKKAFSQLIEVIQKDNVKFEDRVISISHCNCYEKAEELLKQILDKCPFKSAFIFEANGLNTTYQNNGGIVITY